MGWSAPKTWAAAVLTVADMNTEVRDNLAFLKANIVLDAHVELTINAGVVTKTKSFHSIDTAGDIASDDLDTINGGVAGDVIFVKAEHTDRTVILKDGTGNLELGGDISLDSTELVVALIYCGDIAAWMHLGHYNIQRTFLVNNFEYPAPGTDWTPSAKGATLAQNKAAKICWIPIVHLHIGDQIVSYKLVGDVVEAVAATVDCKLIRINLADPITETDVAGGGMTQVDADGNFDVLTTLTAPEVVATDKQYILQITATTGAGDSIIVMGTEILVATI